MDREAIGNKLKSLREERNLTIPEVAVALKTSASAVYMYESGERIPRDEVKVRYSDFFGVPVQTIFFANECHV